MKNLVNKIIETDYAEFHYRFLHFLCRHMLDISVAFNGDLNQFLILLVMDERFWKKRHEMTLIQGPSRLFEDETFSITKISSITMIPRETVRRKLLAMEARGWVTQVSRGKWKVARDVDHPSVENDLDDLMRKEIGRVSELIFELEDFVEKPQGWKSKFSD